jgi:glycosyltransferase involved in cell wall biosynthesis
MRLELPHLKTVRTLTRAAEFYRYLKRHRIDVVQVHHADPTYFAVPIARWAGVPKILQTKYDVGYWLRGFDLWMHRLMRRWVDVTIANCEACRQASIQQEWSRANDVRVVDNGIPLGEFEAIPSLAVEDFRGDVNIGMVANLRPIKDPATFLRAAAYVLRDYPRAKFHLAGDGEMRKPMMNLAGELGIRPRIIFHGHIRDTARFLKEMAICVLCSKSEGLPHALLEYMASGRAVVATKVGGNTELVEDGGTGRLVDPANPEQLAAAIVDLLSNPQQAICEANAARRKIVGRYDVQAMTRRFESFYQDLCSVERRSMAVQVPVEQQN